MFNQLLFVKEVPVVPLGERLCIDEIVKREYQRGFQAHKVIAGTTIIALVKYEGNSVVATCDFLDRGRVEMHASGYLHFGNRLILVFPDGSDFEFDSVLETTSAENLV